MVPTGWIEAILLTVAIPIEAITFKQWTIHDAFFIFTSSIVLLLLSQSIIIVATASIPLVLSFYRLHTLLYTPKTPNRASVNPHPHLV